MKVTPETNLEQLRRAHWRQFVEDQRSASQYPQYVVANYEVCRERAAADWGHSARAQWKAWLLYWAPIRLTL